MAKGDAIAASQLERDAATNPGERTDLLFDAAAAWQRAGEPDRAIALLTELLALGGEPRCFARVCLAEVYSGIGDADRMNTELDVLAREPDLDVGHCELAADLLIEQGDHKAAVRWYDRAIARMSTEAVDELGEPDHPANALTKALVRRRRDARRQLGLEPDRLDELIGAHGQPARNAPCRCGSGQKYKKCCGRPGQ
jgi:tetratricopeptide (TPR) repeat protein